jgi:hypothetical protein
MEKKRLSGVRESGTGHTDECYAHFLWIRDCSSSIVGARSSSLRRLSIFSLLSPWNHHHEGVEEELNREARDVGLGGRADGPPFRSRRERRLSRDKRSAGEC